MCRTFAASSDERISTECGVEIAQRKACCELGETVKQRNYSSSQGFLAPPQTLSRKYEKTIVGDITSQRLDIVRGFEELWVSHLLEALSNIKS